MQKNFLREFLSALVSAWEEIFEWSLPYRLAAFRKDDPSFLTAAAFPLLGWLCGMVPLIAGGIVGWVFNRHAGVLIFAFSAWMFCYVRDFGRGDVEISRMLNRFAGKGEESMAVFRLLPAVARFCMLTVIALRGSMTLLPLIFAGSFGLQAELALSPANPEPLLPGGRASRRLTWCVLFAAMILGLLCRRIQTVVLVLTFFLARNHFTGRMKESGFSAEAVTSAGNLTEWLLLLAATLTA